MPLLEYAALTVPKIAPKYRQAFFMKDAFWSDIMRASGKDMLTGGTKVRFRRVISGHSEFTVIDGANLQIPVNKSDTFTYGEYDWARVGAPLVFPHIDRDRLFDAAEKKAWTAAITKACVTDKMIGISQRVVTGALRHGNPAYGAIGTLNGSAAAAAKAVSGLENGAIRFETPTAQSAGATSYLGLTRTEDTANETNNWYNQYIGHNGIEVDFLDVADELVEWANSWSEDDERIQTALVSIRNARRISAAARTYGGGGVSSVQYTYDDVMKGRILPAITVINGVKYIPYRPMGTSAGADSMNGPTEPALFINPKAICYKVNKGYDMRVGKIQDHLDLNGIDADVGFLVNESQCAVENLQAVGAISKL